MEERNIWANELAMAFFLNEVIGLRNGHRDRLPDGMTGTGSFCISIAERRKAKDGERMHAGEALDVPVGILQRDLSGVDEGKGCRSEADGDSTPRAFDFEPVMGDRTAVHSAQLQGHDAIGIFNDGCWIECRNRAHD